MMHESSLTPREIVRRLIYSFLKIVSLDILTRENTIFVIRFFFKLYPSIASIQSHWLKSLTDSHWYEKNVKSIKIYRPSVSVALNNSVP